MSKLFFLVLVCVSLFSLTSALGRKQLHRGRTQGIAVKIQEEMKAVARTIKNLKISSASDKVELGIMANELTHKLQQAIYVLNQAVPHIQKEQYRNKIGVHLEAFEEILYGIQRSIYDDSKKLQEKFASSLEKLADGVAKFMEIVVEHHTDTETIISEKLRESSDMFIYATYKIFFHATFFAQSNNELKKELESRHEVLESTLDKIKTNNDEATADEVTHLARLLTIIGTEAIVKLEYWLNLHGKDEQGFKVVKETADHIADLINQLHHAIESGKSATDITNIFKQVCVSGAKQIKKLTDILLSNTPGDKEYIRGILIDNLTVSATFTAEINLFINTKNITKFN